MKSIYKYIDKLNYNLGLSIFKNSNWVSLNLYRYFYKKKICNPDYLKIDYINSFYKNGYTKLGRVEVSYIKELKDLLNIQNPTNNKDYLFHYKITPDIYKVLKKIIQKELSEKIKILEKYYNQKIVLTFLTISRNYPSQKKEESYSNFFHTDAYAYNMFKIFVNLHDVNEENGPLTLVKKKYAKEFLKKFDYKSRESYTKPSNNEGKIFYKNTGKMGDVFLCNTTEVIHRAGDPDTGQYRDMIFLNFVAYPTTKKNISLLEYEDELYDDRLIKRLSKIKGLKNLISFYKKNLKEKLV